MALFSFRHSVRTFSEKRTADVRAAQRGQTAAHLRYITRPAAAREVLRERLCAEDDRQVAEAAERAAEARKGRVCERFIIALPVEASAEQRVALVRAFCEAITHGKAGYIAAIHDKAGNDIHNPHAHIAAFDIHEKTGGRGRPRSVIGMARKNAVETAAAQWAAIHNRLMSSWGYGPASHIDHRSFAARGIERVPAIHEGPGARAVAAKGQRPAAKAAWQAIDGGHTRAEANAVIRDINAIREAIDDHEDPHRLGRGNDPDTRQRRGRSKDERAGGERGGPPARHPAPPFAAPERPHQGGGGDQAGPGQPPFLVAARTRSEAPMPPPAAPMAGPDRHLRRGRALRRVYRELVMWRDTLFSRLQTTVALTADAVEIVAESPGNEKLPPRKGQDDMALGQ